MDFSLKGKLTGEQQLRLTHEMLESLELLQLGSQELFAFLENLALENPVIDMDALEAGEKRRRTNAGAVTGPPPDIAEYTADPMADFSGQLRLQLDASLPREVYLAALYLIDNLDDNGYLCEPVESTAARLGIAPEVAHAALGAVRRLEPRGIGARDLRECLLLQLEAKGLRDTLAWRLADGFLDDLARNRLPAIASALGVPAAEVSSAAELLRRECDPRPLALEQKGAEEYVLPDVDVRRGEDGALVITLMQLGENDLVTESSCAELAGRAAELDEGAREFLTQSFNQVKWLRRSLRRRGETMRRCAEGLVSLQSAFFLYGPRALRPLLRLELAGELGVSESTVSRAFSGKYISCEWGVFPAAYFFPPPLPGGAGGATKPEAHAAISELVESENARRPMSDAAIAKKLAERGITISRRTVALYRGELGIPPSSVRKKHI